MKFIYDANQNITNRQRSMRDACQRSKNTKILFRNNYIQSLLSSIILKSTGRL